MYLDLEDTLWSIFTGLIVSIVYTNNAHWYRSCLQSQPTGPLDSERLVIFTKLLQSLFTVTASGELNGQAATKQFRCRHNVRLE